MKIVAVVGSESNSGKTTIACRILRGIPGLGAVKISRREGGTAHVEWGGGSADKDTARYAASGAAVVARIIGPEATVAATWEKISETFRECPGVVIEGRGAIQLSGEKFVIFAIGPSVGQRTERNSQIAATSDLAVIVGPTTDQDSPEIREVLSHIVPQTPVILSSLSPRDEHVGDEIVQRVIRFLA